MKASRVADGSLAPRADRFGQQNQFDITQEFVAMFGDARESQYQAHRIAAFGPRIAQRGRHSLRAAAVERGHKKNDIHFPVALAASSIFMVNLNDPAVCTGKPRAEWGRYTYAGCICGFARMKFTRNAYRIKAMQNPIWTPNQP